MRYVKTSELAKGYIGTNFVAVGQDYSDTLPSGNLTLEIRPNLLARLAAAKVMSRPQLPNLTPGGWMGTAEHHADQRQSAVAAVPRQDRGPEL